MKGLIKGDSDVIGFVISAFMHQAITREDVRRWAESIITAAPNGNYPFWLLDLLEFDGHGRDLVSLVGPGMGWPRYLGSPEALYGIARRRGIELFDCSLSDAAAEQALRGNPKVLSEFGKLFPWIEVPS
jgi:hypothetical protein